MTKRLALVIGTAEYDDNESFKPLGTPVQDADGVAEVLSECGEFELIGKLTNASFEEIKYAIEDLYSQAQVGDVTLIYYSGHGYRSKGGQFHLTAKNTQISRILSTGVDEGFIKAAMSSSRCRHKVVILDCCFSGTFIDGQKSNEEVAVPEQLKGEATAILTSSSRIQFSFEDAGNSLFTKFLLLGIRTGQADADEDGRITVEELHRYISKHVKETRPEQSPMMFSLARDSEVVIARGIDLPRNRIFLCSANNKNDRYFATWLSTKLRLQGYDVIQDSDGHESQDFAYWDKLTHTLGRETAQFLLIISAESARDTQLASKLAVAIQLKNRTNFIIPLEVTPSPTTHRLQLPAESIGVSFSANWTTGLTELVQVLRRANVPKSTPSSTSSILAEWRQSGFGTGTILRLQEERYRSNWFEFALPEYVYAYTIDFASKSATYNYSFPSVVEKNYLLTFGCPECVSNAFQVTGQEKIPTSVFLSYRSYSVFKSKHVFHSTRNNIIDLLNQAFSRLLLEKGLKKFMLSGAEGFYFPKSLVKTSTDLKVSLKQYGKGITYLTGNAKGANWHVALEGKAFFYPIQAYFITYHVVFTDDLGIPLAKRRQHALRRRLGKDWYNKKWRDVVMGAMAWLSEPGTGQLCAPVDCNENTKIKSEPVNFTSSVGYVEPSKRRDE